jgi:hypothetical protein
MKTKKSTKKRAKMRNKGLEKKATAIVNRHIQKQDSAQKASEALFGKDKSAVTVTKSKAISIEYQVLVLKEKYQKWLTANGKYEASVVDGISSIKMTKNDWKLWNEWETLYHIFNKEIKQIGSYTTVKI